LYDKPRLKTVFQAHRYYIQGSLYFMANDPRVPNGTRVDTSNYGYCKASPYFFVRAPPFLTRLGCSWHTVFCA